MKPSWVEVGLLVLAALVIGGVFMLPPLPQDVAYHAFADQRPLGRIPNAGDVLSNVPFLFIGALGMRWALSAIDPLRCLYWVFFLGVFLTGFGSSYYHWWPSNATLVWDRLPMTVAFMPLFAAILAERIDKRFRAALIPFLLLGIASVGYWAMFDDLRLYALVQFLPMILIPIILCAYPSRYDHASGFWWMIFWYALAKLLEAGDEIVFETLHVVSGHSLKHLAAAMAPLVLLVMLRNRRVCA